LKKNRVKTATAAKIVGVDRGFFIEKVRIGSYPGIYEKNGKRANVVVLATDLAQFLGRSMEEIDAAIVEIEGR